MPKVVVIGGGIGGLSAGLFLKKAGWEVIVCEAAPELLPVGKGIWVPTNAMIVLAELGLANEIARAGWALSAIDLETVAGKTLGSFDLRDFQKRLGFTTISIHRAELIRVLAEALGSEFLLLNTRFKSVEEGSGRLIIHLEQGVSLEADLLVGADGLNSMVREVIQPGVRPLDSGQGCARGIARLRLPAGLSTRCKEIWGGKFRFGFSAIGPDEVYWFAPFSDPRRSAAKPLKAFLLESYAGFPPVVLEILRNTPEEEIILTRLEELPKLKTWTRGRVLLLGDAAHAMTPNLGQGGAQAMEDAFFLGRELAGATGGTMGKTGLQSSLVAYCLKRYARVHPIAKTASLFGRVAHWENKIGCLMRDWMLRCTPASVNRARLEGIYKIPAG